MKRHGWLGLFAFFCTWGLFWEWFFGFVCDALGNLCWIYPSSPLIYTSWKVAPLWGFAGLQGIMFYAVVKERNPKKLIYVVVMTLLVLVWVTVVSVMHF